MMDERTTKTEQKTEPEQPPQVQTSEVKAEQTTLTGIQTIPVPIVSIKPGPHALPQPQPISPRKHNRRQQTFSYPGYMGPNMWTSPPYGEQQKNYKSYFGLN